MQKSLEHFHEWVVRNVRDRCLEVVAQQMAMPAGVLSLRELASGGNGVDPEAVARMAMHIIDMAVERFLFEVDQRVTMGELQIELRPPGSTSDPVRVDHQMLVYQLYEEWVDRYSGVKRPADLLKLARVGESDGD